MWTCPRCGANVAPTEPACRYCGAPSPEGAELLREEQIRAEAQAAALEAHLEHDEARALAALQANASLAFKWALAGLFCCIPIPAVVALVLAIRTQNAARRHGNVIPGRATAAVVISIVSLLFFVGVGVTLLVDSHLKGRRTQELQDVVGRTWTSPVIDQVTACSLVELKLIQDGFDGTSWTLGDRFACPGKLEQHGERAVLHDAEAKIGSGGEKRLTACLKRGERWMVEKVIREGEACEPVAPVTVTVTSVVPAPRPNAAPPTRKTSPRRK
jgi:hypothetical protein